MNGYKVNPECVFNYNSLFCHACLSSNRKLAMVGDDIEIYRKICDNSRLTLTPEVKVCWECMALIKKIRAFKKKVNSAQKILEYCIGNQAPIRENLSQLKLSQTESTTFMPILINECERLNNDVLPVDIKAEPFDDDEMTEATEAGSDEEIQFQIVDVRGRVDVNPPLPIAAVECDVTVKCERVSPEEVNNQNPVLQDHLNNTEVDIDDRDTGLEDQESNLDDRGAEPLDNGEVIEVDDRAETPTEVIVVSPETEVERQHMRWKRTIMLIYRRLCGHQYAHHFSRPITDDLAPHYSRVVRRPMDLASLKRRIQTGVIRTTAEFERDLLLMFSNALMYNSSAHIIHQMTRELRGEAVREMSVLLSAYEATSPRSRRYLR